MRQEPSNLGLSQSTQQTILFSQFFFGRECTGIHMKGSKAEMQQESKGSTLHDKNSNMHRAGCTEAGGRQLCELQCDPWKKTEVRVLQDTRVLERLGHSWREIDTCGTPGGSSQNSSLFLSTKISSKANKMSSQVLPAEFLPKGSPGGGGGQPRYQKPNEETALFSWSY